MAQLTDQARIEELINDFGATRKMIDAITTLEEPRIEGKALRKFPSDKTYLRGCAMDIVARLVSRSATPATGPRSAGLLARVDAGILTTAEVKGFRADIVAVLGQDTLTALKLLWQRFLLLDDEDYEGMVEVAAAWLDVLGEECRGQRRYGWRGDDHHEPARRPRHWCTRRGWRGRAERERGLR